ncbi:hypothetical protein [Pseudomonas sp. MUP55]|uniref:hypothetical protein n=1 Tax=Pseudomonas sp. MUP55 TaxID=3087234 RepID=UPI002A5A70A3|nr:MULTISPECIES: hypothetical protein [unclassified Pseudomonas]WPN90482.1 hypothetical protein SC319_14525 [Pseudomonas sp. MUP56]WPN96007.1 hypothetical protein SC318_14530 [Pseudomonas sp. MUP55]
MEQLQAREAFREAFLIFRKLFGMLLHAFKEYAVSVPSVLPRVYGWVPAGCCGATVQFVEVLLLERQFAYFFME